MGNEQTRQIDITLFDQNGSYTACLYLRKGKVRVTGKKYYDVVDMLIELCWIISKGVNQHVTDTRVIPVIGFSRPYYASSARQTSNPQPINDNSNENLTAPEVKASKPVTEDSNSDSDVVDALDKLVHLHKQGYLSNEEFSLAKSKLLQ